MWILQISYNVSILNLFITTSYIGVYNNKLNNMIYDLVFTSMHYLLFLFLFYLLKLITIL